VPFLRRFTGHPQGITQLQRIGTGIVFSILAMVIAGFVEVMLEFAKTVSDFFLLRF
jgi:peptide/histidine transporter 3/4